MSDPTQEDRDAATLLLGYDPTTWANDPVVDHWLSADRVQSAVLLQNQLISVQTALEREGIKPGSVLLHPDQWQAAKDLLDFDADKIKMRLTDA